MHSSLVVVGADTLFDAVDTNHDRSISEAEYNSAIDKLLGDPASGGSAGAGAGGDQHGLAPPLGLDSPSAGFRRDGGGGKPAAAAAGGADEALKFHNPASTAAFLKALFASFSAIMATEIGDKTFFIAAILSMRNDRMAVFGGAILALIVMTILSTLMGLVLPSLIPRKYTHIVGGVLFLYFGFRLLLDSRGMEDKVSEELEEVEEELAEINKKKNKAMKKKRAEENGDASVGADVEESMGDVLGDGDNGAKKRRGGGQKSVKHAPSSGMSAAGDYSGRSWEAVFLQALTMTFLAEWGDRSQIATIALAAAKVRWMVWGIVTVHCISVDVDPHSLKFSTPPAVVGSGRGHDRGVHRAQHLHGHGRLGWADARLAHIGKVGGVLWRVGVFGIWYSLGVLRGIRLPRAKKAKENKAQDTLLHD